MKAYTLAESNRINRCAYANSYRRRSLAWLSADLRKWAENNITGKRNQADVWRQGMRAVLRSRCSWY